MNLLKPFNFLIASFVIAMIPISVSADVIYEESFTTGQTGSVQAKNNWISFQSELVANLSYQSMTISGSEDPTGLTCSDPTATAQFAQLLNTSTDGSVNCDGHTWDMCDRGSNGNVVWIDAPSPCNPADCPNPGRIIRPGQTNLNWGGINTQTCTDSPSQTMRLAFLDGPPVIGSATPIPTMSVWGLGILAGLLGLIGFIRRRKM